ncbi:CHAT domain-containing protein [Amycolatopsis acidiphila]|uniref:CHAT domain-containing protein n=1 Tax=Amycolatopsis acidiphila TaxID=715473 RepID=A0A558ALF3_9PSEU|nr:CHAT domain-containing protein [Amycolatopsis acidiphila]TVT25109.1 CHAT domain-containing protein [Amycolatopsis acidiphila]UIJ57379.1 CHAT domain-containing protein [Amycolatopsis acidiphila]GHG84535.1 hypothetical protein GCM10017788_56630 [Amycolatopsis acidiphila]
MTTTDRDEQLRREAARLEALLDDEQMTEERWLAEAEDSLAVLARLAEDPLVPVRLPGCTARILALRYAVTSEVDDLDNTADLLSATVPTLPGSYPDLVEELTLLADARREQYRIREDRTLLPEAIEAATRATAVLGPDHPLAPACHLQLAELRFLLSDCEPRGDTLDRIAESLAIAVRGDVTPEEWGWYGEILYERGTAKEDPADLRAAAHWLSRAAEQQDDAWLSWATAADACLALFDLTQDIAAADQVVEYATRVLGLPLPKPELAQEYHYHRLNAAFLVGERPGLRAYLGAHPALDWVAQAQSALDLADDPDVTPLLAFQVTSGWIYLMSHVPEQVAPRIADLAPLFENLDRLLELAGQLSDVPPEYHLVLAAVAELMRNQQRIVYGDRDAGFQATRAALACPELADLHPTLRSMIAMASTQVGTATGALAPLDAGLGMLMSHDVSDDREASAIGLFFEAMAQFRLGAQPSESYPKLRRVWEMLMALPPGPSTELVTAMVESLVRVLMAGLGDSPPPTSAHAAANRLWTAELVQPMVLAERVTVAAMAKDSATLRTVCQELDLGGSTGLSGPIRGMAYNELSKMDPHDSEALRVAIEEYEAYVAKLVSERHPSLEHFALALAEALRRRNGPGDRARSRRLGLEVLRNAAWSVLLQSGSEAALRVARSATAAADRVTAWCRADGSFEELVQVLDERRGLVLRAANSSRTITEQLADLGETGLAARWEAASGHDDELVPGLDPHWGALRRSVLRTLGAEELVAPTSVDSLRAALGVHGSDLLAYLVPGTDYHGALLVVVPVRGNVIVEALPGLESGSALAEYQAAYDQWYQADDPAGEEYERWREALRSVCAWAWAAGASQVLRAGRAVAGGRDPRVVLVPVGNLGAVPWHAAFRRIEDKERYLVQDATVSYVPSGQLLCEAVHRPEVTSGRPVLVGNPAGNLGPGAYEAFSVREAFYPAGSLLGTLPRPWVADGAGTAGELLERLGGPLPLVHLACHAEADLRQPLRSTIELADGDVSSTELLRLSPTRALELGLAVLAGCTTNASGVDHDEALSLSTTFLAIGARTVIGSLWLVPAGRATVQLMFLFHHNLRQHGLPPAEALRRAQLWLLDPQRSCPDTMPLALRALPLDPDDSIECWAGFTHQGC